MYDAVIDYSMSAQAWSNYQSPKENTQGERWGLNNKIKAVWNSFKLMFSSSITSEHKHTHLAKTDLKRVITPSARLSTAAVQTFMQQLTDFWGKTPKANTITAFTPPTGTINDKPWTQITDAIDKAIGNNRFNPDKPTFIPVVVSGQALFESQHIVLITVKDGEVEFYDPKGIYSENYDIGDDKTLMDVIDHIKDKLNIKTPTKQNPHRNQMDVVNCGVNVCERARKIMEESQEIGKFDERSYTSEELAEFRGNILNVCADSNVNQSSSDNDDNIDSFEIDDF